MNLDQALPQGFDALLLPGGVFNPDALRMEPEAVAFVKAFFDAGKGGLDLPRPLDRNRAGGPAIQNGAMSVHRVVGQADLVESP